MIFGYILLIIWGLVTILKCSLDFPFELIGKYPVDLAFTIFAIICGVIMLVLGIYWLTQAIQNKSNTKRKR